MLAKLIRVNNGNFHRKFFNGNFYEMCRVGDVPVLGKRANRADILIMSERGRHHRLINPKPRPLVCHYKENATFKFLHLKLEIQIEIKF